MSKFKGRYDLTRPKRALCWLCNKALEHVNGTLVFAEFTLPNGAIVKMHKVCAKDFKENPCSYDDQEFTLDKISASWLGHGKQIPIGKMMAWLIKEIERRDAIDMEEAQRRIELRFWLRLKEAEAQLTNLQHKVAETADKCGVPHDNDFEASETLDRIAEFYIDEMAHGDRNSELKD